MEREAVETQIEMYEAERDSTPSPQQREVIKEVIKFLKGTLTI